MPEQSWERCKNIIRIYFPMVVTDACNADVFIEVLKSQLRKTTL
jgi:hypothetical protein